ncbi:hypothetical protein C3731_21660, partial [Brucella oryzae]
MPNVWLLAFNRSDAATFSGAIGGQGEVVQKGAGETVFTGNNTYSGGLTVERGTARAGIADNAFGSGLLTVKSGGTADLDGFNTRVGGLTGAGGVTLGKGTLTLDQNVDSRFSGLMSGTGGVRKTGLGVRPLTGASRYSGGGGVHGGPR